MRIDETGYVKIPWLAHTTKAFLVPHRLPLQSYIYFYQQKEDESHIIRRSHQTDKNIFTLTGHSNHLTNVDDDNESA